MNSDASLARRRASGQVVCQGSSCVEVQGTTGWEWDFISETFAGAQS